MTVTSDKATGTTGTGTQRGAAERAAVNAPRIPSIDHEIVVQTFHDSKIGSDEFVVAIEGFSRTEDFVHVAEKVLASIRRPLQLEGREAVTSSTLGIAIYPHDGSTPQELMKAADAAMYRAKELGRDQFTFYSPEITAAALVRFSVEQDCDAQSRAASSYCTINRNSTWNPTACWESRRCSVGSIRRMAWLDPARSIHLDRRGSWTDARVGIVGDPRGALTGPAVAGGGASTAVGGHQRLGTPDRAWNACRCAGIGPVGESPRSG